MALSPNINVMIKAAEKAGRGLVRDFGEVEQLQVSRKGPADFVSAADLRAEKILHEELKKARPDYGFLMEERGTADSKGDEEFRFIIDPLDGTTNFLHGIPHWAISIGLEHKGEIVAGVIFDPTKNEMFWAEKGQGAFHQHKRLRVSSRQNMLDCVFATGMPAQTRGDYKTVMPQLMDVMRNSSGVRRFSAASLDLAYVAAGRVDGYWEYDLKAWDTAAGVLMIKEAGGFVTAVTGNGDPVHGGSLVAANAVIHADFRKLLNSSLKKPDAA